MRITADEATKMLMAFSQILNAELQEKYEECEYPRIYDVIKVCEIEQIINRHNSHIETRIMG